MDNKNFSSNSLLDVKFTKNCHGYDPLEVDKTLDKIIDDYKLYDAKLKELNQNIASLENDLNKIKSVLKEKEIEIAKYKNRLEQMGYENPDVKENIKLLQRIDVYEKALYLKGVDPKKLK